MSRPHRLTADCYVGFQRYFITICAYQRSRPFLESSNVRLVRLEFLQTAAAESFTVLADCFMPDHMHAIVEACGEQADLRRFVKLAKQRSGFKFVRSRGCRLWQDSYFDRTLRTDEALPDVIRYIIANPVRAGFVERPEQYPHWGSGVYTRDEILEFVGLTSGRA